jgi:hypothetical protein
MIDKKPLALTCFRKTLANSVLALVFLMLLTNSAFCQDKVIRYDASQGMFYTHDTLCLPEASIVQEYQFRGFSLYTENDSGQLLGPNKDDNYTGSGKLSLHYDSKVADCDVSKLASRVLPLSRIHEDYVWITDTSDVKIKGFFTASMGFVLFTPNNLDVLLVDSADRPFANYKFVEFNNRKTRKHSNGRIWNVTNGLMFGKIGKNLARDFQVAIHINHIGIDAANSTAGWEHQLGKGDSTTDGGYRGEFAFNYTLGIDAPSLIDDANRVKRRIKRGKGPKVRKYDWWNPNITPRAFGYFGTYLNKIETGLRFNLLFPIEFTDVFTVKSGSEKKNFRPHLFFDVDYNYVIHNTMLQGRPSGLNDRDIYHLTENQIEHHVLDAQCLIGFTCIKRRFSFYYKMNYRSKEFNLAGAKKEHWWGSINILYNFR